MAEEQNFGERAKTEIVTRVKGIRLRTLFFTVSLIVMLIIYFFIQANFSGEISWVDLCFLVLVQTLTQSAYFPDGKLFGTRNKSYMNNKTAYNDLAKKVNDQHLWGDLREYCKYDFEKRKKEYVEDICVNDIGIGFDELEHFRNFTEEEVKQLKVYEFNGKLLIFTKRKRRALYNLLFKKIPVEENDPMVIMSGLEKHEKYKKIHDGSVIYDKQYNIAGIIKFVIIGILLAYLAITLRDGATMAEVFKIGLYVFTIVSTAITSFTAGETSTRVYKNNFYINLSNFLDGFFEWCEKNGKNALQSV